MIWNILLTILFVFLNAFFVAAEFAIVKVRSSKVELSARTGNKIAKLSKNIIGNLDTYLSATQLGITMTSLGLGWIGESVVAQIIMQLLRSVDITITQELAHKISLPTAFALITFLHIVFGELAPKNLAIQYPEKVTYIVSIPLKIFQLIFSPFIWILNYFAMLIIKMLGLQIAKEAQSAHSPEELLIILQESSEQGVIETYEHKLIENVLDFSDTPVKQVMVPRNKIVAVELGATAEQILDIFLTEGYSRIPIFEGDLDNIIGEIYAKDLIGVFQNRNIVIIHDIIRKPFFVQENDKIHVILRKMQSNKIHLAVVLDEFGGTAGIVSLEDILEELVGEIQDEYDEETTQIEQIDENTFLARASLPIEDANDTLPEQLPDSEDYETIGGLILTELGRIPELGEKFEIGNYLFEILGRSQRTLEKVMIKRKQTD